MKSANLEKLSPAIEQFMKDRDWDQFHSIKNLVMALSVECAELVELFQWTPEEESNQLQSDPKKLDRVRDEVADITIYLIRILQKTGINLEKAVADKMRQNAEKYPIAQAKGSSKKYDEHE